MVGPYPAAGDFQGTRPGSLSLPHLGLTVVITNLQFAAIYIIVAKNIVVTRYTRPYLQSQL